MLLSKHTDYYLSVNSTHSKPLAVICFCSVHFYVLQLSFKLYFHWDIFFQTSLGKSVFFFQLVHFQHAFPVDPGHIIYKNKHLKKNILKIYANIYNNSTFEDNFQVILFFLYIFFKYILMHLEFSNLNSIHWIIKKIQAFMYFSGYFQDIS